jgi:hypothetical protein
MEPSMLVIIMCLLHNSYANLEEPKLHFPQKLKLIKLSSQTSIQWEGRSRSICQVRRVMWCPSRETAISVLITCWFWSKLRVMGARCTAPWTLATWETNRHDNQGMSAWLLVVISRLLLNKITRGSSPYIWVRVQHVYVTMQLWEKGPLGIFLNNWVFSMDIG